MLTWFAKLAFGDGALSNRHLRQRGEIGVEWLKRQVITLLLARALHIIGRVPPRRMSTWRVKTARSHFMRSLLGARLRRALNHNDIATNVAQLIAVLRNLDAYAAHLARCIRSCRRRLWRVLPPMAPAVALNATPALTTAFADSS